LDRSLGIAGTFLLISAVSGATCDDELLNAAKKFADTVIQHGWNDYGFTVRRMESWWMGSTHLS